MKSMPEYIDELSGNDFEVLEEIFLQKYQAFIQLYWLLNDYSENIKNLTYNRESDELNISFKATGINPDELIGYLSGGDNENVEISKDKKWICIIIHNEEES